MINTKLKPGDKISVKSMRIWRIVQLSLLLVGLSIVFCLIFFPTLGIHLFWNILIPVAPLLLVVATGLWRNICPMGTTSLLPRHLNLSKRKKLTVSQTSKLNLIAVIALFVLVPLRHAIFNLNGLSTAILLIGLGLIAIILGSQYEWKSAWCSGLCPVHPVEKLYGLKNKLKVPNVHCALCFRCTTPCPDKTNGINPLSLKKNINHKLAGVLMVGAFPGFVWGWFQVKDIQNITSVYELLSVYILPVLGLFATTIVYFAVRKYVRKKLLTSIFSFSAVACYYWFRIPALFGFGVFPGDGMLVDLTSILPEWIIMAIVVGLALFLFWWIVLSKERNFSWVIRPRYANKVAHQS